MTPVETILPELSDSEQVRELRFHLRSLRQGVAASIAKLETCLPVPAMEPAAMWQLRETLADAAAAIEHDAQHHVQRALELASAEPGGDEHVPARLEPPLATVAAAASDTRDQLAKELGVALTALARTQAIVVEVAMARTRGTASLHARLTVAAAALQNIAWPAALRCLALARELHHAADPAAAAAEAREDELATPREEVELDGARSLDVCPRCGAPLTADDRTFDGSYCESCRTRFSEPVARNE